MTDRLQAARDEFRLSQIICWFDQGSMLARDEVERTMRRFADEVMPKVDRCGRARDAAHPRGRGRRAETLERTSKTSEFLKAAGTAAARPLKAGAHMIMNPVETAKGVGAGASRFLDRAKMGTEYIRRGGERPEQERGGEGRGGQQARRQRHHRRLRLGGARRTSRPTGEPER